MSGSQYMSNKTPFLSIAFCAVITFAGAASGQITLAALDIGGPGALGCADLLADPPVLSNGELASGVCEYQFNQTTNVLTLIVSNSSQVVPGTPNPVITQIFVNLPQLAITGGTLISQVGAGGATPNFNLATDVDNTDLVADLTAGCFGKFGIRLDTQSGLNGGIANPLADTLPGGAGAMVIGPVTFTIQLTGTPTLSMLRAQSFSHSRSVSDTSGPETHAAFRFQAGGTGYIGCAAPGNGGAAAGWIAGDPTPGNTITVVQAGTPQWFGAYIVSLDPGPINIHNRIIPIGLPFFALAEGIIPSIGYLTSSFEIPDLGAPEIGSVTFYAIVVLASPDHRQLSISEQLSLSVDF